MEIKVRAFDGEKFIYSGDDDAEHYFIFQEGTLKAFRVDFIGTDYEGEDDYKITEVKPVELWSTLQDVEGMDLYAGDVVEGSNPDSAYGFTGEIKFDTELSAFVLSPIDTVDIPLSEFDEIKIIGNIHTTPELLGAESA